MNDIGVLALLVIILTAAFLGGFLAKKVRKPPIVGYLIAGLVLSTFARKILINQSAIWLLGEMGIAFLMFTLGLEFSFSRLKRIGEVAFWGGLIQVLSIILIGIFIFPLFGLDFYSSLFLSSALAFSSTALVMKLLMERGETESLQGEIMLGWLLVQDLIAIALIIIIPNLAVGHGGFFELLSSLVRAIFLLLVVLFFGRKFLPFFIQKIADLGSRELLLLSVVSFCLLTAIVGYWLGWSIALGAFVAGLLISETTETHAIFSEIRPLRDIFSIIFFVSLGLFSQTPFLWQSLPFILLLSLGTILIKLVIVSLLVLYLGYHLKTALLVGFGLVQVGEFAFILSQLGFSHGLINENIYSYILAITILTILATPWCMSMAPRVYLFLKNFLDDRWPRLTNWLFHRRDLLGIHEDLPLSDHVVICGHGRVGSWLGRFLQLANVPYVVVDYDHRVIEDLKLKKIPALYGDPADIDVLDFAQVDKARVVVVAVPDEATAEVIVANCQTLNPGVKIITRAHQKEAPSRLKSLGVTLVIQPEFEAALSMIHRVMQFMGKSKEEVASHIKRIKIEHGAY